MKICFSMYEVRWDELLLVHDLHPQYLSTARAGALATSAKLRAVQHHRAHVASVLAERGEWTKRVVGVSLDGTGYGDDSTDLGRRDFRGQRARRFRTCGAPATCGLAGGDAAAHYPVQAAAGFLAQIDDLPDLRAAPFAFPKRYWGAMELVDKDVRLFPTTSVGRLFDAVASLLGFTRDVTFEGQAAIWLEQLACRASLAEGYPFPFDRRRT